MKFADRTKNLGVSLALAGTLVLASGSVPTSAASQTDITFWVGHGSGALHKAMVYLTNEFNRTHPRIHVTMDIIGASVKALAAYEAGHPPNAAEMQRTYVDKYARAHALLDLVPYIHSKVNGMSATLLNSYYKTIWNYTKGPGNHVYMLPFDKKDMALYYNPNILAKAHVQPPKTWAQFPAVLEKIKQAGYIPISYSPGQAWFNMLLTSSGGSILNKAGTHAEVATPKGLAAMAYLRNLVNKGLLQVSSGYNYQLEFGTGKVGILVDSTAGYTYDKSAVAGRFKMEGAPIPAGSSGKIAAYTDGIGLVAFNTGTKAQKEASWIFDRWMALPQQNAYWVSHTDYLPTSRIATHMLSGFYKAHPVQAEAMYPLEHHGLLMRPHIGTKWNEISTIITNEVDACLLKKASPKQAVTAMQHQIDQVLSGQAVL